MFTLEDVFVGTPTHWIKRYCAVPFTVALKTVLKELEHPEQHQLIVSNSPELMEDQYRGLNYKGLRLPTAEFYGFHGAIHKRIAHTMNVIREQFLKTDCTWLLSLESDLLLTRKTMIQLLTRVNQLGDQPYAVYTNCYAGFINVVDTVNTKLTEHAELYQIDRITLGCTLINRRVIAEIPFRWDATLLQAFHDAFLAHDMNDAKYPIYYDPMICVQHLQSEDHRGWDQLPESETKPKPESK